jgi:hypothetical protein
MRTVTLRHGVRRGAPTSRVETARRSSLFQCDTRVGLMRYCEPKGTGEACPKWSRPLTMIAPVEKTEENIMGTSKNSCFSRPVRI